PDGAGGALVGSCQLVTGRAGGALAGGAPNGGALAGRAPNGGALAGGAPNGGALDGGALDGGALAGGAPDIGAPNAGAPDGGAPVVRWTVPAGWPVRTSRTARVVRWSARTSSEPEAGRAGRCWVRAPVPAVRGAAIRGPRPAGPRGRLGEPTAAVPVRPTAT